MFTAGDWPEADWTFGPVVRVAAGDAVGFADGLEKVAREHCDLLLSLERVWSCDVYRAGDGVHRAWLDRRSAVGGPWQRLRERFNRKHAATLSLEESLFAKGGAKRVIANSRMVKEEIIRCYGYSGERVQVVYNGLPLESWRRAAADRAETRTNLGVAEEDVLVLFAGSGWERKGLRFAIEAIERQDARVKFLVAGRGEPGKFPRSRARFLGVVREMASLYHAADIFLLPTVYDPFSNACLEALAAGRPVITTRANGFCEIMENGRHGSILENPGNAEAMADALQFWSDPARRAQAETDNLALAGQFDISRNVSETLGVLAR